MVVLEQLKKKLPGKTQKLLMNGKRKIRNNAVHPIPIRPFLILVSAPHRSKNNAPITRPST